MSKKRSNINDKYVKNYNMKNGMKNNVKNNMKNNPKKGKSKAGRIIKSLIKAFIILFIFLGLAGAGILAGLIYGYAVKTEPLKIEDLQLQTKTTFIYDDAGNEIARLTGSQNINREIVYYKDVPKHLANAFIAIEDERFEKHFGVDVIGIMRAVVKKILNPSAPMQGASTITQQVVRNLTGTFEVKLDRKIREWVLAVQLERKLEKWQILELYMNLIYMGGYNGNNYYGVQSASKAYFGKDVSELSLAECALLAGITNAPTIYAPINDKNKANAKVRQEIILAKMLELGYIDEREYEQAIKEPLKYAKQQETRSTLPVQSYFVDYVVEQVINDFVTKKGMDMDYVITKLYNHGLRIYTTQNTEMQKVMDKVFTDDQYFYTENEKAIKNNEHAQAAMVVIDPYTGQIKAMYGGYGEKKASRIYNRATQSKRQPGSSFKPIAVYGPAIDLRLITPATVIDDIPVYLNNQKPNERYPLNFDRTYGGLTTIRNAIKNSINVVAARVWYETLGADNSIEYLKKVGIDRENEKYVSISMGGLEEGVNPLLMAAAYVPFVNKGLYLEPVAYTKVLDSDGKVLLENKQEYRTVYDETSAYLMLNMLQDVTRPGGTAADCIIGDGTRIPTAGKTGTTNDNIDKWFVGFTPYYVAATWYGYDNTTEPIEVASAEQGLAKKIWTAVMNGIHEGLPAKDFEVPTGLEKRNICIYSGKIATELCAHDPRGNAVRSEYFIKGTEPHYSELCDVHVKVKICNDSKDALGRPLPAGPNCPPGSVSEKILIRRPEPYTPQFPGEPLPLDLKYDISPGEYCPVHGAID